MKLSSLKRHIFLILSLLFLGLAALNFWFLEKDAPGASEEHYVSSIRKNVREEILLSKTELTEIGTAIQKTTGNSFGNYEGSATLTFPYYAFKMENFYIGQTIVLYLNTMRLRMGKKPNYLPSKTENTLLIYWLSIIMEVELRFFR
jgi:hypothetical protein